MNFIQTLAISALPIIFAITLHEAAHGYAARHFGDPTAWQMGRISLNPLRHIDPIGTVILPIVLHLTTSGSFVFGWAKPVPVNASNLRHPKEDMLWVAAAGPAANLAMAIGWVLALKVILGTPEHMFSDAIKAMAQAGIFWNVGLMVLNLLPIPPLDGGRIVASLLPMRAYMNYARIEPFGIVAVLVLLYFHVLDFLLLPILGAVSNLLLRLLNF